MIAEGLALIDKADPPPQPRPYQVQAAIAALHARAARAQDTDWAQIDLLYATLERLQPSPVVTLNRAVAVAKLHGAQAALEMIEPLAPRLSGYFYFFGVQGALLQQLGRPARRAGKPSTRPLRSPTPRPRPRVSGCISTGCSRTGRPRPAEPGKIFRRRCRRRSDPAVLEAGPQHPPRRGGTTRRKT